jgi:hypothetical protein
MLKDSRTTSGQRNRVSAGTTNRRFDSSKHWLILACASSSTIIQIFSTFKSIQKSCDSCKLSQFFLLSLSPDFRSNKMLEVNCQNPSYFEGSRTYSIETFVNGHTKSCKGGNAYIILHDQNSFEYMFVYYLRLGMKERFMVEPKITRTDESLRSLDPEKWVVWIKPSTAEMSIYNKSVICRRGCFFGDEKKLDYFNIYTLRNCLSECKSKQSAKICGCVLHYLVRKLSKIHFRKLNNLSRRHKRHNLSQRR